MIAPPLSLEAEIAVAERASKRDLTAVRRRGERRRSSFECRERTRNLVGLMTDPFRLVPLGCANGLRRPEGPTHPSNHRRAPAGATRKSARRHRSERCGRRPRDDRDSPGSPVNRTGPCRPRARAPEFCRGDSAGAPCHSDSSYPQARWRCRARGRARSRRCAPYGRKARRESCAASTRQHHLFRGDGDRIRGQRLAPPALQRPAVSPISR